MKTLTRRDLLKVGSVSTALGTFRDSSLAQQGVGAGDKYDLLIKGGEVLDPSQNLRAKRDVAIKNAVVAALAVDIPSDRSAQIIDAKNRLVTPGLVDLHAHVYPQGSARDCCLIASPAIFMDTAPTLRASRSCPGL